MSRRKEALPAPVVAWRPYKPAPFVPPRAGSMRASELPSRVGSQRIYPRRAKRAPS